MVWLIAGCLAATAPVGAEPYRPCVVASADAGHFSPCLSHGFGLRVPPEPISCSENSFWWLQKMDEFARGERPLPPFRFNALVFR